MPIVKPQSLKSLSTIAQQPQKVDSRMEAIMCMDLAGKSGKAIAVSIGIGECRVSVIRNSPLYMNRRDELKAELEARYMDKQTDVLTSGDPVEEALKSVAITAVNKKIDLMRNSQNEFVASAAAGDILDRAGYKSHSEKTKVTVEVTEKMANRFERALGYEPSDNVGEATVRVTKEMSS